MAPSDSDFAIVVVRSGDRVTVALQGELDCYTGLELRDRLTDLIEDQGERHVAVDLRRLRFADSTGLGVLLGAHRRLERHGGRLVVVGATATAVKVLQLTGMDQVLTLAGP